MTGLGEVSPTFPYPRSRRDDLVVHKPFFAGWKIRAFYQRSVANETGRLSKGGAMCSDPCPFLASNQYPLSNLFLVIWQISAAFLPPFC